MRELCPPSILNLKNIGLKSFSKLFSVCFGFSRAGMYFLLLVQCALEKTSMEALSEHRFFSSDRLFFYLNRMSVKEITEYCNVLLKRSFLVLWSDRWHHRPVLLAIDTTDQRYFGRDNEYVHSDMKMQGLKKKTIKVLRYATISIVARNFKFTLAIVPKRRDESLAEVVDKLIRLIPPELKVLALLMDKGFYLSDVFKTVEKHRLSYIVPVKQYRDMDLLYSMSQITGKWHWKYTMNRGRLKQYTYDVYLQDLGIEYYCGFATNLKMTYMDFDTLLQAYRRRWNIENSYKDAKEYLVSTNSRNHGYRVLVFALSHLLLNLHSITKRANKKLEITVYQMKKSLEYILSPLIPVERPREDQLTKHLIIVY